MRMSLTLEPSREAEDGRARPAFRASAAGRAVASVLAGSWRRLPMETLNPDELSVAEPYLLRTGAAGLGWWRAQASEHRGSIVADELRQAYLLHVLHAALHEERLARAVILLRAAGTEPLLGKGWAAARLYPDPGLRPYGDIDLYVSPDEYPAARRALATPEGAACAVDLHRGCAELSDRTWDSLEQRATRVVLPGVSLRLFGAEDHLRLLALHFLRHGAWRPLWLCDVAAALERRPADFDWDRFLAGDTRRTDWAVCALVLARDLLGASLSGVPEAVRARRPPAWLTLDALQRWGDRSFQPHGARMPMATCLRRGRGVLASLRQRWPNGTEASVGVRAPFNDWPRFPFQIGACLLRGTRFLRDLPRQLNHSLTR